MNLHKSLAILNLNIFDQAISFKPLEGQENPQKSQKSDNFVEKVTLNHSFKNPASYKNFI